MERKDNYSILAYGDSITKGIVYDPEKGRYSTLKDSFTNIISGKIKGTVYNSGKFGNTIVRAINKMYTEVIKKNPDIVLIEFGGNDCDFDWSKVAENPYSEHKPKTDIDLFKQTLLEMITTLKNANIVPILMTLPPLEPLKYFSWISKGESDSARSILYWLGNKERIFTWHAQYNAIITEMAENTKTALIDVRQRFLNSNNYGDLLCNDGIHPNLQGHLLIADEMMNYMEKNFKYLITN